MDIKIIVATHKQAQMPTDECYLPLHVGCEGKQPLGFQGDNTGDNISTKNTSFCELTGIYWAWKNLKADYVGLVHYRRHFSRGFSFSDEGKWNSIFTKQDYEALLAKADLILPGKRHYFIETTRSQYEHAHNPHDLVVLQEVLAELHPEALPAFDKVMKSTSGHRFNMFVMKRDLFDDYCNFLFSTLFELEKRVDVSKYNAYNSRVFGFLGERLMDVWVQTRGIKYAEQSVIFMGNINWLRKGYEFIKRKLTGGVEFER